MTTPCFPSRSDVIPQFKQFRVVLGVSLFHLPNLSL